MADGLGGHRGGREASQLAVHTVEEWYAQGEEGFDLLDRLERAFAAANRAIVEWAERTPELRGMATTCSVLVLRPVSGEGFVAHVGDSRIYQVREGEARQVTTDHSVVGELVRGGVLTAEEAARHPRRNVLRQALGTEEPLKIELLGPLPVCGGDTFVLCSDGLAGLPPDEIARATTTHGVQDACDALVSLALDRGETDDITVLAAHVAESVVEPAPADDRRPGATSPRLPSNLLPAALPFLLHWIR